MKWERKSITLSEVEQANLRNEHIGFIFSDI